MTSFLNRHAWIFLALALIVILIVDAIVFPRGSGGGGGVAAAPAGRVGFQGALGGYQENQTDGREQSLKFWVTGHEMAFCLSNDADKAKEFLEFIKTHTGTKVILSFSRVGAGCVIVDRIEHENKVIAGE